jgi:hypothetical protein
MKKIFLLSDTHGFIDPHFIKHMQSADEIWHAGDIGNADILDQLNKIKPVRAVYGNIDGNDIRKLCNEYEFIELDGFRFLLIHIAGTFGKYNNKTQTLIKQYKPQALICGHSHILKVAYDKKFDLLYINPGAAGNYGFHKQKTALTFTCHDGKITNLSIIEINRQY